MLKFKVDENMPVEVATLLAGAGDDAATVIPVGVCQAGFRGNSDRLPAMRYGKRFFCVSPKICSPQDDAIG